MTQRKKTPQTQYLADYKRADFTIEQVTLDFSLFDNQTIVTSKIVFKKTNNRVKNLHLTGEDLTLLSVSIDQKETSHYEVSDTGLTIKQVPNEFTLSTQVLIHPEKNTLLSGLYRSNAIFCTQCEAEGFRRITYFLDRPDVMTTYQVRIEADKTQYPVLLSNGNLVEQGDAGQNRHFAMWHDPFPKPSYLFALVAGDLACINKTTTTQSGRDVLLEIYTEKAFINQADYALGALERSLKWDEETFNLAYDLDRYMIVAISDFNAGAMENKGLNLFNAKYVLASPETATDKDFFNIENIIGHEYFHNWSGNRVTCRDWFQLSLKEGLTVFRDALFSADMTTKGYKRLEEVRTVRDHQFIEDQGPMSHPVRPSSYIEINNFYTLTVYEKGGEIIRMMYQMMGAETFKRGLALYFERHDGQAVTVEDFATAMSDASGIDLTGQFFRWYTQSGTPTVRVNSLYDAQSKTYKLTFSQHHLPTADQANQADKQDLVIPIAYRLFDEAGQSLCDERTIVLTESEKTIEFGSLSKRPVASILRNFSAPVRLHFEQSIDDLHTLVRFDDDLFVRYDALHHILKSAVSQLIGQQTTPQKTPQKTPQSIPQSTLTQLVGTYEYLLTKDNTPAIEKAELLALPSLSVFFSLLPEHPLDAVDQAVKTLSAALAQQMSEPLQARLSTPCEHEEHDLSFAAVSERSYRNACLQLLSYAGDTDSIARAKNAYDQAQGMTNRLAALEALNQTQSPEREAALSDFYQRFESDPQALDKWFAVHASADFPNTIDTVKSLATHPKFQLTNPNKVRALYGTFCMRNLAQFHHPSGQGYRLLSDLIATLDTINPSLAARMASPLTQWQRFDDARQDLMKTALTTLVNLQPISDDLYEIISKSLAVEQSA
ncbi:aminopeptidase N [Ostreibacterium oceani]|uniref:Aminopeptidase N n=1 Tax=Ostreibacterium oceani TaxID=2654998 RepID=A0A6N7EVM7_9GAMM|nr:aminopeptidase N [Ostreibacterium oceani]MPV85479.1 aminopeptidase N [Ostreibacterium oceani]